MYSNSKLKQIIAKLLIFSLILGLFSVSTTEAKAKKVEKIVTYSEEAFWRNYYACYGRKDTFDLIVKGPEASKVSDRLNEAWDMKSELFKEYHDKSKIYQSNMLASWFSGMTVESKINEFSPNDSIYTMHFKKERFKNFERFEKYVEPVIEPALEILKEMDLENKNDYERIYAVSKWLAEWCQYDWEYYYFLQGEGELLERYYDYEGKSACAYEAIMNHRSVCSGYTGTTSFLLGIMGYEVVTIHGKSIRNVGHAWNYVKLDGEWYALDNTWNDTDNGDEFRTDYFLVGADTFYEKHIVSEYDKKEYPLAETAYQGNSQIELSPILTGEPVDNVIEEEKVEFPSIKVEKSVYTITVGKTIKPVITIKNPNNEKVTYTSSNKKIATVNSKGKIKAKKKGTVTITVRVGENSAKKFKVKIKGKN